VHPSTIIKAMLTVNPFCRCRWSALVLRPITAILACEKLYLSQSY